MINLNLFPVWRKSLALASVPLLFGAALLLPYRTGFAEPPMPAITREQTQFFEQNIRPILAAKCGACHAATSPKVQGGLLLDSRDGWQKGGTKGSVIVPGKPQESRLIHAVKGEHDVSQMPPGEKLTAKEIAALESWIQMGAPDPRTSKPAAKVDVIARGRNHWAFQPLKPVVPPTVKRTAWAKTPIDKFILAEMEQKGVAPNKPANRRTLIRRITIDLTGLPPTVEEVENFVNDKAPNAWAKVVDRLLASPHYGERYGRHWLDLARFAESHGFEHDYDRPTAYPYRDFVIKALNADMPYNQFVAWQLAGDEFAPDDPLALAATGFLAAGVHSTQITKSQVEKERYDELDDMLATTGTAMLGLTLGCARCHDHKYDPIPTRDYYRLLSTFTTTVRSEMDVPIDREGDLKAKTAFDAAHKPLVDELTRYEKEELPKEYAEWIASRRKDDLPFWELTNIANAKSEGGATLTKQADGSYLVTGKNPDFDTYTLQVKPGKRPIAFLRIEAIADPSMTKGGPGRAGNGNFALSNLTLTDAQGKKQPLQFVLADFEQTNLSARFAVDDDPKSAWAVDPQFGKNHAMIVRVDARTELFTLSLQFNNNVGHNFGRFRLSTCSQEIGKDVFAPIITAEQIAAYTKAHANQPLTDAETNALLEVYRPMNPRWRERYNAVQEHLAQAPKSTTQKILISSEGVPAVRLHTQGGDFLPETHFLNRGDVNQKREVVSQGFLTILAHQSEKHWQTAPPQGWRTSYRRRALAGWLTDTKDGAGNLLARVIVNRLWQHHFGKGIVRTPSDFGTQGERPTHPALLDYLASELIRNGWKLKLLHRQMLLSSAYLQSANVNPTAAKIDPENRLFARFNRQRVEAEVVRDSMLAVSGELDSTMYGIGTLDENMRRRSVYFTVKRSKLIPSLHVFDSPDALQGIGFRQTTTVAPQALLLLNNKIVREYAGAFAKHLSTNRKYAKMSNLPTNAEFIEPAYLMALSRPPTQQEHGDTLAFLNAQAAAYREAGKPDANLLARTDFCQALFSLNEFLFVE